MRSARLLRVITTMTVLGVIGGMCLAGPPAVITPDAMGGRLVAAAPQQPAELLPVPRIGSYSDRRLQAQLHRRPEHGALRG